MSEQGLDAPPPLPSEAAPPTMPGRLQAPAREPTWPTALGIVMIVFSAGGVIGSMWGLVWWVIGLGTPEGENWPRSLEVLAVGSLIVWLVWLGAAIGLLMRKQWVAVVLLSCATIKLVLAAAEFLINYASIPDAWTSIFGVVTLVMSAALPVFTIIWFMRPKVRAQVAGWNRPRSAPPSVVG